MSIHNVCFQGEIRKILCGHSLFSEAIILQKMSKKVPGVLPL